MTDQPKRCVRTSLPIVAALAAAAFLLVAESAQAGLLDFLGRLSRADSVKDTVGFAKLFKKHVGKAIEHLDSKTGHDIAGLAARDENEARYHMQKARKHEEEIFKTPANIARDAGSLGPVYDALESGAAKTEHVTKGLRFAKEKISRIFGGGDGNDSGAADALPDKRAALVVDKSNRNDYEARSDIFGKQRLPVPAAAGPSEEEVARVSAYARDCWRGHQVGRYSHDFEQFRVMMERRRRTGASMDCSDGLTDRNDREDDAEADPWADDGGANAPNQDVWAADTSENLWNDAQADPWADDARRGGTNEDLWAAAGPEEQWNTGQADRWSDDGGESDPREDAWAADDAEYQQNLDADYGEAKDGSLMNVTGNPDSGQSGYDDALGDDRTSDADYQTALSDLEDGETERQRIAAEEQERQLAERRRGRFSGSEEQERQIAEQQKRQARLQEESRSEAKQQRQQQVQANRERRSGSSCDSAQPRLTEALKQIRAKADNSGMSGKYCAAVNIARAVTWTALRCLDDPTLDAEMKEAMRGQIKLNQDNVRQNLEGFHAVATSGASCGCWTEVCADGFDGD